MSILQSPAIGMSSAHVSNSILPIHLAMETPGALRKCPLTPSDSKMCECFMDLYLSANDNANVYAKMCLFPS